MGEPGYASPIYDVEQMLRTARTGSLVGTVGATEKLRYTMHKAGKVTCATIREVVGGTAATRLIQLGKSLAGTGAVSVFGTQALGTDANGTVIDWAVTGSYAANDDLVVQHLGTDAQVYDIELDIFYQQAFVNA